MLLHHFSSRNELVLAVVDEIERRQRSVLKTLPTTPADGFAAMWNDVRRPELRPFERLFFECYARAAQGEEPFARMVPGAVDDWLGDVGTASAGAADPAMARLGLAVVRGLLLDLTATNDDEGVDSAARAFVELLRHQ
jgi:AcrR family transcriptional regulator